MDYSLPGSSVHGDSPGKSTGVGLPCPPPGDLPNPGIEAKSSALAGGFFTTEPPGKPDSLPNTAQSTNTYPKGSVYWLPGARHYIDKSFLGTDQQIQEGPRKSSMEVDYSPTWRKPS